MRGPLKNAFALPRSRSFARAGAVMERTLPMRSGPGPIVQFKAVTASGPDWNITLDSDVSEGNILVAFCMLGQNEPGSPAVPTDNHDNIWIEPSNITTAFDSPAWYALDCAAGATTVSFANVGFSQPVWIMVLEVAGWTAFDDFEITENDPPQEEGINVTTVEDGDVIIALFAGQNTTEASPSQWTAGTESTEILNGTGPYDTEDDWGFVVEYQIAGVAGVYASTATYDTDLGNFNFCMAIAFKGPASNPLKPRIGPLSMDNFVPVQ